MRRRRRRSCRQQDARARVSLRSSPTPTDRPALFLLSLCLSLPQRLHQDSDRQAGRHAPKRLLHSKQGVGREEGMRETRRNSQIDSAVKTLPSLSLPLHAIVWSVGGRFVEKRNLCSMCACRCYSSRRAPLCLAVKREKRETAERSDGAAREREREKSVKERQMLNLGE